MTRARLVALRDCLHPAGARATSGGADVKRASLLSKEPALLGNSTYSAKILPGFMIPFGSNTALTAFM